MNIQIITGSLANAYESPPPKAVKAAAGPDRAAGVVKESVELSQSSVEMQKVRDKVNAMPEVRIAMVEKIKERIKHNDYPLENALNHALDKMLNGGVLHTA